MKWSTLILIVLLTGCVKPIPGNVLSVTSRTLGIDFSYNPDGMPHLKFGFVTTQYHQTPTSTNQLYAPPVYSSIDVGQKLASTQISEDYATGTGTKAVEVGNAVHASPAKLGAQRPKK